MLKMIQIEKSFNIGTINEKQIFNGLNLTIHDGDFITVIGGNGAGKSTMLNLIAGVHKADGGRIILDGEDLTYKNETQRAKYIGRVFQDPMMGTAPTMMIEENLAMAYRRTKRRTLAWGISQKERELYRESLAQLGLGLEDRMKTKVGLLSGGQRQAVTLLMATLQKPKLLLLDEHTAALDPKTAQQVMNITKQVVQRDNITTLMVTHNIAGALSAGNKTLVLNQGRVLTVLEGEKRAQLTPEGLMSLYGEDAAQALSDRMLL